MKRGRLSHLVIDLKLSKELAVLEKREIEKCMLLIEVWGKILKGMKD